jgi:hypothetical protein
MAVSPIAWRPCCLRTTQLPLAASPCGWLSQPRSTISQSDCRRVIGPFLPFGLGGPYKPSLEPDGSPLFTWNHLTACWRYEPRKHLWTLAMPHPEFLPSPLRDRVGYFHHDRFRGYLAVHCCSGLQPPCLRFAMAVAGHHARLGTRLRARLCRGLHFRKLNSMSFQGTTRTDPDERSLAHTVLIADRWRRSERRERNGASGVEVANAEPK